MVLNRSKTNISSIPGTNNHGKASLVAFVSSELMIVIAGCSVLADPRFIEVRDGWGIVYGNPCNGSLFIYAST